MWFFDNRIDAFLVEQAILQSTIYSSDIPEGLDENWAGSREVRLLPKKELIDFMQNLVEEHHEKGRWQFVLDNIELTQNQRESVLKKNLTRTRHSHIVNKQFQAIKSKSKLVLANLALMLRRGSTTPTAAHAGRTLKVCRPYTHRDLSVFSTRIR